MNVCEGEEMRATSAANVMPLPKFYRDSYNMGTR